MTYRRKKLRTAPPGPRHRPPGTPRRRTNINVLLCTHFCSKKFAPFRMEPLDLERIFISTEHSNFVLRIVPFRTEQSIRLILLFCSEHVIVQQNFAPCSERSVLKDSFKFASLGKTHVRHVESAKTGHLPHDRLRG